MAAEYRQRAPNRIREAYTWDKITDQYEELFGQLAAGLDPTRLHSTVGDRRREEVTAGPFCTSTPK